MTKKKDQYSAKGTKAVTKKAEPKIEELSVNLRHEFGLDEINNMVKELTGAVKAKAIKEDEKTAIVSQYKAEIDGFQAKITSLSEKISAGFEMRMTKVRVVIDYEKDMKTVTRLDTMEVVSSDKIPADERQMELSGAVMVPGGTDLP